MPRGKGRANTASSSDAHHGSCSQALELQDHLDDASEATPNADELESCLRTVKMKLSRFCDNRQIRATLDKLVADMNVLLGEAYAFANLHILRLLEEGNQPLPRIDRNFYYRCLLAVSENRCRGKTLGDTFPNTINAFDALRPTGQSKVSILDWGQVVADLSISMATMATNHLWMNLESRLVEYVKWRFPELSGSRGLLRQVVDAVLKKPKADLQTLLKPSKKATEASVAKHREAVEVARQLRQLLSLPGAAQCASRAHLTLPLYHRILQDTNAARQAAKSTGTLQKLGRPFALLPTKHGFTLSYIPISSMTFMRILKLKKLEVIEGDGRDADHLALWRKYFNTRLVETGTSAFSCRILTDGCGVSVMMDRQESSGCGTCGLVEEELTRLRTAPGGGVRVVGVDPGITDVVTVSQISNADLSVADGHHAIQEAILQACPRGRGTVSYSSARFYESAKYNLSNRKIDLWNAQTLEMVEGLPVSKVASVDALERYTRRFLEVLRPLLQHRAAKGYRNMRFLRYVHRNRVIHQICEMIAPRSSCTIVGFEDWGGVGKCRVSRRTCGPVQEIKRRLQAAPHARLISIDKHRTSKVCCHCHGELVNKRAQSTRLRMAWDASIHRKVVVERMVTRSRVHKVLHCRNSATGGRRASGSPSCPGATCNRDVNAAKNILLLTLCVLKGVERPRAFCPAPRSGNVHRPSGPTPPAECQVSGAP